MRAAAAHANAKCDQIAGGGMDRQIRVWLENDLAVLSNGRLEDR